jgi:uncharacterized membrane protein
MLLWIAISAVWAVLPLVGIGELYSNGLSLTVGGLFMSLILLAMSGIFLQSTVAGVRRMRAARQEKPGAEPMKAQAAAGAQKGS